MVRWTEAILTNHIWSRDVSARPTRPHSNGAARACRTVPRLQTHTRPSLDCQQPPSVPPPRTYTRHSHLLLGVLALMVSIQGHTLQQWLRRRDRARRYLLLGHAMGLPLAEMGAIVCAYRRAQREVCLSLARRRRVHATNFNPNGFSSVESLSLFRFLPSDVGRLTELLQIEVSIGEPNYRVTPIECMCIVLRRLASPARWSDLEETFGRSTSATSTIFYATVEMIMSNWGVLLTEWRGPFMRQRAAMCASSIEQSGAFLDRCAEFTAGLPQLRGRRRRAMAASAVPSEVRRWNVSRGCSLPLPTPSRPSQPSVRPPSEPPGRQVAAMRRRGRGRRVAA